MSLIRKPCYIVYISGHGFGHLAQLAPILHELQRHWPQQQLIIRSRLSASIVDMFLHIPYTLLSADVDVGVVQKDAISEDWPASYKAATTFFTHWDQRIDAEYKALKAFQPQFILSNISPLAFPLAQQLGIPGLAIASLDWFAIYQAVFAADTPFLHTLKHAYGQASCLLKPPLSMPMSCFKKQQSIDLLVQHSQTSSHLTRQALGLQKAQHLAAILFGGAADPDFCLPATDFWRFGMPKPRWQQGCIAFDFQSGLRASDIIKASDLVIGKPGYNLLAECFLHQKPLLYLARPSFPEYPILKQWLDQYAPAIEISQHDWQHGHFLDAMHAAYQHPRRYPECHSQGHRQACQIIRSYL